MTKARQLDRIIGNFNADEFTALRQTQFICARILVNRQMSGSVGSIRHRISESRASRDGEEKARAKSMRNAQQIAKIHGLGNSVSACGEIATHIANLIYSAAHGERP